MIWIMVNACLMVFLVYLLAYLKIQYIIEEMKETKKAKARKASVPVRETAGIENQLELKPLYAKSNSLKPGTKSVTR